MPREELIEDLAGKLKDCFEFFSVKLSGNCCLVKGEIKNFLKLLSKQQDLNSLGDWFCWNYVAFQFEYYSSLRTQMMGKYPANWIFGPKALQRWNERNSEYWLYQVGKFMQECEIQVPVNYFSSNLENRFEEERRRFLNSPMGLLHCQQFSRFSDKSPTCMICKNKGSCKELWK